MQRILIIFSLLCGGFAISTQAEPPLSAADSDPVKLQWMQGFPPAADKQFTADSSSFFQFPAMRWSVAHMRQFMPTVEVSRGLDNAQPLPYALDKHIDGIQFIPLNSDKPISFKESLGLNYTDGLIVLHRGKVVYEQYFGELSEDKQHAAMSVTKSITGLLAAVVVTV